MHDLQIGRDVLAEVTREPEGRRLPPIQLELVDGRGRHHLMLLLSATW